MFGRIRAPLTVPMLLLKISVWMDDARLECGDQWQVLTDSCNWQLTLHWHSLRMQLISPAADDTVVTSVQGTDGDRFVVLIAMITTISLSALAFTQFSNIVTIFFVYQPHCLQQCLLLGLTEFWSLVIGDWRNILHSKSIWEFNALNKRKGCYN